MVSFLVSAPILGIDLGTTNSLVGVFEAGFPGLLADRDGERLLPSAVFWPEEGEPEVGRPALRRRALHPGQVFTSIKRLMGQRLSEVDPAFFPYKIEADAEGAAVVRAGGALRRPEEISACVLRALKSQAEAALGVPVERAVITVPAYFHDAQRQATKRAGELAGLTVERILSEPTAAALAYGFGRPDQEARIAVFDFGGGTFDLSVLELNKGVFEVLATCGDTALGGDDIDRALVAHLQERIGLPSPDAATAVRLREAAEAAKIRLSTRPETEILLPFIDGRENLALSLTREELESVAAPTLARLAPLCRQALHDARLAAEDLHAVILVGGSTRMPAVRQIAAEIFGQDPHTSTHPDEAIALGACLQAAILEGHAPGLTLLDVTPLSLGIETFGGLMNVLIPRNTSIPCRAGEMFTNVAEGQTAMRISVLQGEREMARDNWLLGELTLPFTPAPRGQARVGVQFSLDANGILEVLARDTATGHDEVLQIEAAVRVEDARVEEMIQSSVEHALEDMNERRFTELKMKAEELLAALEAAFAQLGDSLPADEREEITALADRTKEALATRNLRALQDHTAALDELTEPLAAKLLEKLLGD
jgi:molecular chaperone DnaK